jgi:hypothetical protein
MLTAYQGAVSSPTGADSLDRTESGSNAGGMTIG